MGNFHLKMTYNLASPVLALYITCVFSFLKPSLKPQKLIKNKYESSKGKLLP